MSSANVLLRLPVELSGHVIGGWLDLRDVVRLDSAFCHQATRAVVHSNVFQSPFCVLVDPIMEIGGEVLKWIASRKIRLEDLRLAGAIDSSMCEAYLREFGGNVKHFTMGPVEKSEAAFQLMQHCVNVRSICLQYLQFPAELIKFVDLIRTFASLEGIMINETTFVHGPLVDSSARLSLRNIQIACDDETERYLLRLCAPETVQRLQVREMYDIQWNQFTALRSVGFNPFTTHCARSLSHVLEQCPWVEILDMMHLSLTPELKSVLVHGAARLRTLNIEDSFSWVHADFAEIVVRHKDSLERLFLFYNNLPPASTNFALSTCAKLHTLSCTTLKSIDTSLMKHITTLAVDRDGEANVWQGLVQHCHNLQHLYLRQTLAYGDKDALTSALLLLPALQSVTLIGMLQFTRMQIQSSMRIHRPNVKVVVEEEDGPVWYNLFELPF